MGGFITKLMESWGKQPSKIVMVGLDAAGKTTVLYKLKLGEVITTTPTVGFNVETVQYKKLDMTVWDIGGQDILRKLWRHYYQGVDAVIYIVDSNDADRMNLAAAELHKVLDHDELRNAALLVYANKQDLPHSMDVRECMEELGLKHMKNRQWHVQPAVATSGEGLWEGLDWLNTVLTTKRR